jgi:hypothetical protein
VAREQRIEFFLLPATHHEVIIADPFRTFFDQLVPPRDQQLPILRIERGDTCEGQLTSVGRNALSEERLPGLPFQRGAPFPDVQDQRAIGFQRLGKSLEDRVTTCAVDDVIQDAAAQNRGVSGGRQWAMSPTLNETWPVESPIACVAMSMSSGERSTPRTA